MCLIGFLYDQSKRCFRLIFQYNASTKRLHYFSEISCQNSGSKCHVYNVSLGYLYVYMYYVRSFKTLYFEIEEGDE